MLRSIPSSRSVWLVADHGGRYEALERLLQDAGLVVTHFVLPEEALAALDEGAPPPDLIVTRLHTPGLGGLRFCRALRSPAYPALNDTPVLAVSATYVGMDLGYLARALGANIFCPLPVQDESLLALVADLLEGRAPIQRPRALLVSADDACLDGWQSAFESFGYEIARGQSASQAGALCAASLPDAVVVSEADLGPDGRAALSAWRQQAPDCALVVVRALDAPSGQAGWLARGADIALPEGLAPELVVQAAEWVRQERLLRRVSDLLPQRGRALAESEDRLRRIVETAYEGIFEGDVAGRITYVNPYMAGMLGYSPDELLGGLVETYIFPDELAEHRLMAQRRSQGLSDFYERRLLHKDGHAVWALISAIPVLDANGQLAGTFAMVSDITERRQAEETLAHERSLLRTVIDNLPVAVYAKDLQGRKILTNPMDLAMMGVASEDAVLNRTDEAFFPPDLAARFMADDQEVITTRRPGPLREYLVRDAQGNSGWLSGIKVPLLDANGEMRGLIGINQDITERKRAEEELRQSEERYRRIVETTSEGIWQVDPEGRLVFANKRLADILGYTPEELLGRNSEEFVLPQELEDHYARIKRGKHPLTEVYEQRFIARDGRVVWALVSATAVTTPEGEYAGALGMLSDITERKLAEERLRHSQERAHRQRAALASLATDAAIAVGDLDAALARLVETMAATVGVDRASVWLFSPDNSILRCIALYDRGALQSCRGIELSAFALSFPHYLAALRSESRIYAADARRDERTQELYSRYLLSEGIVSLLDSAIVIQGRLVGVTSIEHRGEPRQWHADEEAFSSTAAAVAGQILVNAERKVAEEELRRSEAELAAIHQNAPVVMLLVDRDHRVLKVNSHASELSGRPAEEMQGLRAGEALRCLNALDSPDGCGYGSACAGCAVRRMVTDTLETGRQYHLIEASLPLQIRDRESWVTFLLSSALLDDGANPKALVTILDITERKDAEQALARERALLRTVVDNLPLAVYAKDLEGRKILTNRRDLESMGAVSEEQVLGKTDWEVHPQEVAERNTAIDRRVLETGRPLTAPEVAVVRPSGEEAWIFLSKVPLRDASGQVTGLVGISQDITERKKIEQERLEMQRQLLQTQKLESLGVLAGGVAHDFNNLLMAILGNLDLALMDLSPLSPARDSIVQAMQAGRRAADVARQMLAYSGRGRFLIQRLNLTELVEENARMLRAAISGAITLSLQLAPNLPPIEADPGQVQQVILNLITNASEAIGEGPGIVRLSTGEQQCDDAYLAQSLLPTKPQAGRYVYIEVADTGSGMSPETLQRIFEPFYSTKATGRGLGMAAVQGIAIGHGGAILINSALGKGTTIRALFRAADGQGASDARVESSPTEKASRTAAPPKGITVLVVDDEEMVRQLAQAMLERLGYTVLSAGGGRQAVEVYLAHTEEIGCVLLDLTMPQMDGAATFSALRALNPNLPVILSSGYSEGEVTQRFAGAGLAGFIEKPYSLARLVETLDQALSSPQTDE